MIWSWREQHQWWEEDSGHASGGQWRARNLCAECESSYRLAEVSENEDHPKLKENPMWATVDFIRVEAKREKKGSTWQATGKCFKQATRIVEMTNESNASEDLESEDWETISQSSTSTSSGMSRKDKKRRILKSAKNLSYAVTNAMMDAGDELMAVFAGAGFTMMRQKEAIQLCEAADQKEEVWWKSYLQSEGLSEGVLKT